MSERCIALELLTPEGVVMHESVDEVMIPGRDGYFGVLPGHTYFATLLKPGRFTARQTGHTRYYDIGPGVVQVTPDRVIICTESAQLCEVKAH